MRPALLSGSGSSINNTNDHSDIMRYRDVIEGVQSPSPRRLGAERVRNSRESIGSGPERGITVGTEGPMTATRSGDRERDADRKARRREQARHDRAVRRAQGRCQACGVTCAPGSRSRCLVCLERDRRGRRRREGKTTVRPTARGRPLLGAWRDRRRAYERDEALQDRAVLGVPMSQRSRRQWQRFADVQARQSR